MHWIERQFGHMAKRHNNEQRHMMKVHKGKTAGLCLLVRGLLYQHYMFVAAPQYAFFLSVSEFAGLVRAFLGLVRAFRGAVGTGSMFSVAQYLVLLR